LTGEFSDISSIFARRECWNIDYGNGNDDSIKLKITGANFSGIDGLTENEKAVAGIYGGISKISAGNDIDV
jgi:hypothetical protein